MILYGKIKKIKYQLKLHSYLLNLLFWSSNYGLIPPLLQKNMSCVHYVFWPKFNFKYIIINIGFSWNSPKLSWKFKKMKTYSSYPNYSQLLPLDVTVLNRNANLFSRVMEKFWLIWMYAALIYVFWILRLIIVNPIPMYRLNGIW